MLQGQAITRFDLSIRREDFDLKENREGYIGMQVMPPCGVAVPSSKFSRLSIGSVLSSVRNLSRAPRTSYQKDEWGWTTDSYNTDEHGLESDVDDREIELYGDFLPVEMISSARVLDGLLAEHEMNVANLTMDATKYTGNQVIALTGAAVLNNTTTSTPVDVIDQAKFQHHQFGIEANTLIIPAIALRYVMRSSQILDRIKYSGQDNPKKVTINMLKEIFELDKILVGKGYKNITPPGTGAPVIKRLWDPTMMMVCRTCDPSEQLTESQPCLGRTVMHTEGNAQIPGIGDGDASPAIIMEEYREERRRGGVIRGRWNYDLKSFGDPFADGTFYRTGVLITGATNGGASGVEM